MLAINEFGKTFIVRGKTVKCSAAEALRMYEHDGKTVEEIAAHFQVGREWVAKAIKAEKEFLAEYPEGKTLLCGACTVVYGIEEGLPEYPETPGMGMCNACALRLGETTNDKITAKNLCRAIHQYYMDRGAIERNGPR